MEIAENMVHTVNWNSQKEHWFKQSYGTQSEEHWLNQSETESERSCVSTSHHQIWPARAGPATMDMTHDPKTEQQNSWQKMAR